MVLPAPSDLTPEAYLAWERSQEERHFFVGGEVFAMAGGSPRHNRLCARVIAQLEQGLNEGPCGVYTSDQRLGLPNDDFVYADAVVLCTPLALRPGTSDVVTNPRVVVEVLSKSTQTYDRGDKQQGYLSLPSVAHFLLFSQREPRVEMYTRQADEGFRFDVFGPRGVIDLRALGTRLDVDALYAGVFDLPGD
jgi:Uma2 family endonuclease